MAAIKHTSLLRACFVVQTNLQVDDTIQLSILEIYNEQIRDLLIESNGTAAGGGEQKKLEVRVRADRWFAQSRKGIGTFCLHAHSPAFATNSPNDQR